MIDHSKDYVGFKIEFKDGEVYKKYKTVGKFDDPTDEEIRLHSKKPFKIFRPSDGSYAIKFYDENEIKNWIVK